MPLGNINEQPNYNNRYKKTSSEVDGGRSTQTQGPCPEAASCDVQEPKSPDPMLTATARRAVHMAARRTSCGKMKSISPSTDSPGEDVFVEVGEQVITDPVDIIRLVEKKRDQSISSTVSLIPNPFNKINHRIHSFFWCSCCLFFFFICCLPAVHNMQSSDKAFREGDEKKAQRLGKMATVMFVAGTLISLSIYAAILFVVIFFTTTT